MVSLNSTGLVGEMQQTLPEMSTLQLTEMFSQNMDLSNGDSKAAGQPTSLPPSVEPIESPQPTIKYSISQHYTHSAHIVQTLHPLQPSNEDTASRMLIKHGIAPSSLLRAQLTLFEQADEDQRSRLIELWTIVPPTYARNGGQDLADKFGEYQITTLAQEEELARQRYYCNGLEGNTNNNIQVEQVQDRKPPPPVDFFLQSSSEGLQRAISQHFPTTASPGQSFESNGKWSEDLNQQKMEHQYGHFDHMQRQNGESQEIVMEDEGMLL